MRPERGEWEPIKQFRKRKFGLDPNYVPNPRVLGEVQSSYRGATPTQNNPRNKSEQAQKQNTRKQHKNQQGIYHRLIRRSQN